MKFSFVIPVYNAEKYLEECVASISNQSYKNIEILLIDDGSKDTSGLMCDRLSNKDSRIRVIHKTNEGPGIARNIGVKYAMGDFIIFCDADDYYSDNDFLKSIAAKITADTGIVVFNYSILYDGNVIQPRKCITELKDNYKTGGEYLRAALSVRYDYKWYPWLYAFRKELFDNGIEFPREKLGEDTATIYKLVLSARKVEVEKKAFYIYRINSGNNITSQKTYEILAGTITVAKRCIENVSSRQNMDPDLKVSLCNNFATAYFIALIQADNLNRKDLEKLLVLLKNEIGVTDYATSPKQAVAKKMIRFLGLRATATIFGIRRRIREKK